MLEKFRRVSCQPASSANWIVHTNQFGPIGECRLHLYLRNHLWYTLHDLIAGHDLATLRHKLSYGLAVACSLQDEICNKRDALGIVELDTSCEPLASDARGKRDHKLVFLTRREVHESLRFSSRVSMTTSSAPEKGRNQALGRIVGERCANRAASRRPPSRQSA